MQVSLIESVNLILEHFNYKVLPISNKNNCFDITAKNQNSILFIKCIPNSDNFGKDQIAELKLVAETFQGIPLIISDKNKHYFYKENVIYEKDDIKVMKIETFQNILANKIIPFIHVKRGGEFVEIDPEKFKESLNRLKNETDNFNMSDFAKEIGVSRRTISYYQKGEMSAKKSVYDKMKKKFGTSIFKPIDIMEWKPDQKKELSFNPQDELRTSLSEQLEHIGLSVLWTKRTPFDGVTDKEYQREVIITGIGRENDKKKILIQKIKQINDLSDILNSLSMFIVENEPIKEILIDKQIYPDSQVPKLPLFNQEELDDIKNVNELMRELKKEKKE
ncbi:MAG: hypothetical protein EAX96_19505 [Candidatus Lokiarchaeota archaeon]|nr:hypothetical protein [Candidatus Lokiarchaeota archaeon]